MLTELFFCFCFLRYMGFAAMLTLASPLVACAAGSCGEEQAEGEPASSGLLSASGAAM